MVFAIIVSNIDDVSVSFLVCELERLNTCAWRDSAHKARVIGLPLKAFIRNQ